MDINSLDINPLILIISIVVALSGWATFLWDRYTDKPKITGRICTASIGELIRDNEKYTLFIQFLYLTNSRSNGVHILDYKLGVDLGHGFENTKMLYGAETINQEITVQSTKYVLKIPKVKEVLLTQKKTALEYGKPLYGILLFVSDKTRECFDNKVKRYCITVEDILGYRHKIINEVAKIESTNIFLLPELFGVTLEEKK